ncbi:MAG: hypothetical protein HQM13_20820 [SAR324 cluster bacterium]|nr:hypothetical protein [SAR324 cluster bacterium]
MLLLSFHIVAVAIMVAVTGSIAYQMGKKEGIRITDVYHAEMLAEQQTSSDGPQNSSGQNQKPGS